MESALVLFLAILSLILLALARIGWLLEGIHNMMKDGWTLGPEEEIE